GIPIAMGANSITLGAGQTVDGKDVSGLCTTAEALAYVNAQGLALAPTKVITSADENIIFTFGRTQLGLVDNNFYIGYRGFSATSYALLQSSTFSNTYLNSNVNIFMRIANVAKMQLTASVLTMSVPIAMGANKITGCGDPINDQDVATKIYVATQTIASLTLQQVTDNGAVTTTATEFQAALTVIAPTADMHAANRAYVDAVGKITPPAHAHGSDGFVISGETWSVVHTDLNAKYNMTFIVPKTANYKILIIHRSTVATRTDGGTLSVSSRIGATSGNNWGEALPLINLATNNWIFTRSSAVALTEGYVLYGAWQKNDNPGTGNLQIYGVWLEEQ
ncbi:hypothetical protein LCGC14_3086870, partial [marine sediment metagenome]